MASTSLTGERRWGQTRKLGMTVLGKVPKPINLPSQRLENHGLDPNVEIVPKGTLNWGSRPSLTTSNAWGSSSLSSPKTDGSTASPSCLSGRPSSGGSCTRPSTSASDRSYQATSSAWGPNSRPSSASGILPSNQTSGALARPRSAETRPGSSLLSCFPEPVAESQTWGSTRTAEKLISASKSNTFTLSSGDFPTLGSEKNQKSNVVQQDHSSQGRPASASGRVFGQKETVESTLAGSQTIIQLEKGNVSNWRQDNDPYIGSASPTSNWHGDQQQMQSYPRANAPSQQFDPWLRAPVQSSSDGMWYNRGAPPGGAYGPGGPPGSYPVEPYIYYAHLPARPLSNSQGGPRHGPVASGYAPMNGVPYRPHAPDSYIVPNHPVGPMRPEVYSHQVHYENYYGPAPNVGNGNERDGPVLGVAPCSSLSNQPTNRNMSVDSENLHAVPWYYAPSVANEQAECEYAHGINGPPYKVLLKQHDGSKKNDSEEKDQSISARVTQLELGDSRPSQKSGNRDEPVVISQHAKGLDTHSSVSSVHKDVPVSTKFETLDDHCAFTARKEDPQRYSVKRNSTLIEKIESLNNKARIVDGRSVVPAFVGEESSRHFMNVNTKAEPTKETNTGAISMDKSSAEKVSFDGDMEIKDVREAANSESVVDVKGQSRTSEIHTSAIGLLGPPDGSLTAQSTDKRVHGKQNRADNHAKSRLNGQDVEEWRKKSPGRNSSAIDGAGNCIVSRVQDSQPSQAACEKKEFHNMKVADDKYSVSSMDLADYKAQQAKMKEIARQRAKQLQKEEEERIREQKARALAKLQELNRRTLAESSNQTVHPSPSTEAQSGQDARTCPDLKSDTVASEAPASTSGSANAVVQKADKINSPGVPAVLKPSEGVSKVEKSVDPSLQSIPSSVSHNDPSMLQNQGGIRKEGNTDLQFHDNSVSKQKQIPPKRPDNRPEEKPIFENVSIGVMVGSIIVGSKGPGESAPPSNSTGDGLHSISKDVDGHSMQHKKRNNRIPKNKNRLDETPNAILPSKKVVEDVKTGYCKPKPSESEVEDDAPVLSEASNKIVGVQESSNVATISANQGLIEGTAVSGKATVQWRPQPPKRITRNPQSKPVDKFHGTEGAVWAPVKSTNRKELPEEVQKAADKTHLESLGKNGNDVEHNLRSKRAEMERYVPKPIAKELTQQETSQPPPSSCVHQVPSGSKPELGSEGTSGEPDRSATVKIEVPANTKNGENSRPTRHGRAHASWRRRGPPESSSLLPSLLEGSSSSDSNKDTQKASCLQQPSEHDNSQKEQPKTFDDGWNDDNDYGMQCEPVITFSVDKNHGKVNRGRRQPYKGHKVIECASGSRDNWEPHGRTDKSMSQMMTMEPDESAGRKTIRSESQSASSHVRSHWQPKSQTSSAPNHCQGTTETGVQRVASQGDGYGKDSPLPLGGNHDQHVENKNVSTAITLPAEVRNPRHHEAKRERSVREESSMRQNRTPHHELRIVPEPVPQNAVPQYEPISSGARHHGQHGGWLARSPDVSFGGGNGQGQGPDAGSKQNQPANVDRRKQYQRTGYYYGKQNDSANHSPAVGEAAQNVSKPVGKYRERGHNHPRRGSHVFQPE